MDIEKRYYQFLDVKKSFSVADYFIDSQNFIRIFNDNISSEHFVWHRDERSRSVKVVYADKNWSLQFDNFLPFNLIKDMTLNINKNTYHKLHKGSGTLILLIKEY